MFVTSLGLLVGHYKLGVSLARLTRFPSVVMVIDARGGEPHLNVVNDGNEYKILGGQGKHCLSVSESP